VPRPREIRERGISTANDGGETLPACAPSGLARRRGFDLLLDVAQAMAWTVACAAVDVHSAKIFAALWSRIASAIWLYSVIPLSRRARSRNTCEAPRIS
jgi:hypothetical protein